MCRTRYDLCAHFSSYYLFMSLGHSSEGNVAMPRRKSLVVEMPLLQHLLCSIGWCLIILNAKNRGPASRELDKSRLARESFLGAAMLKSRVERCCKIQ
jgi:hypothetical protein